MDGETIKWMVASVIIPSAGIWIAYLQYKRINDRDKNLSSTSFPNEGKTQNQNSKKILKKFQNCSDTEDLQAALQVARKIQGPTTKREELANIVEVAIARGELDFALAVCEEIQGPTTKRTLMQKISRAHREI